MTDGVPVPVEGLRQRAVLAVLLLRAGHVVSVSRLVDAMWQRLGQHDDLLHTRLRRVRAASNANHALPGPGRYSKNNRSQRR